MIKKLLEQNPLFVFALEVEAAEKFKDINTLFVGVGKINAAYKLSQHIAKTKPSIVVNLGSAGSRIFKRGEVVCCTEFIQRDMDVTQLGCKKYETPFSNIEPILKYGLSIDGLSKGICGTGDNFDTNLNTSDYTVVDMEAYSLAYVAQQENIPFLCLKYISDGADDNAAEDWPTTVRLAAETLRNIIDNI